MSLKNLRALCGKNSCCAAIGKAEARRNRWTAAAIVPRESDPPTAEELTEFCRERLAPYEIPATFQMVSELPHTAKGSLDRRAVVAQFGQQA